ncbi:MAG TPA: hypothetical protein P5539_11170 [Mesotoga sp.]|nr:hypothetical protein [Mesotoga sp.]
MKKIALVPHALNISVGGETITVEPSGDVARVSVKQEVVGEIDGIPVVKNVYGEVTGLPEPTEDTIYIVSGLVLSRTKRKDVFAPDTGATAIRNDKGQIEAVTRLVGCD